MHIFLYGPPGSGKTTLGYALAEALELPFLDLDDEIQARAEMNIPQIFEREGEAGFRERELVALAEACAGPRRVIALGGGALVDPRARTIAEANGTVLCLHAEPSALLERLEADNAVRPLLSGDAMAKLTGLLERRGEHYASFAAQLDTTKRSPIQVLDQAQRMLGAFRVRGMGQTYDVLIEPGGLDQLGEHLQSRGLKGPLAVVTDRNVAEHYQERVETALRGAGFAVQTVCIPPGEAYKKIETVTTIWEGLLNAGVERGSTVIALGGGVVGDLTGFAAATILRGVAWVNVPTTLLAMVDSSTGGKTGFDLPQGKNLVGAFYPPRLVLADPQTLGTLPDREQRGGLAETLKHGVIGDPDLFALCAQGWEAVCGNWDAVVRQGMAVKLKVIAEDPYEKGLRQALNLGHTIGHGVELASDFQLSHGESVAIGMAAEARLAEAVGLAEEPVAAPIAAALKGLGLPTQIPTDLPVSRIAGAMRLDKKKAAGQVRFALPVRIGNVRVGITIEDWETRLAQLIKPAGGRL